MQCLQALSAGSASFRGSIVIFQVSISKQWAISTSNGGKAVPYGVGNRLEGAVVAALVAAGAAAAAIASAFNAAVGSG